MGPINFFYTPTPVFLYKEEEWCKNKLIILGKILPQDIIYYILFIKTLVLKNENPEMLHFEKLTWLDLQVWHRQNKLPQSIIQLLLSPQRRVYQQECFNKTLLTFVQKPVDIQMLLGLQDKEIDVCTLKNEPYKKTARCSIQ